MKIVVVLSGGLDSTALLYALKRNHEVRAVTFYYRQRHDKEIDAAIAIAEKAGVDIDLVDIQSVGIALAPSGSALLGGQDVPHGHYADESMKKTVVPNRNMIFLSIAAGIAMAHKFDAVAYGAHAGDHAIYPDCRPMFFEAMRSAIESADESKIALLAPFIDFTKADIVEMGKHWRAPLELTWSCYEGGDKHCGQCGTCVERKEAFREAGGEDPTEYAC
jgi:7-cyano-7-deazaguanine synthase